jgi:hypothetical protein
MRGDAVSAGRLGRGFSGSSLEPHRPPRLRLHLGGPRGRLLLAEASSPDDAPHIVGKRVARRSFLEAEPRAAGITGPSRSAGPAFRCCVVQQMHKPTHVCADVGSEVKPNLKTYRIAAYHGCAHPSRWYGELGGARNRRRGSAGCLRAKASIKQRLALRAAALLAHECKTSRPTDPASKHDPGHSQSVLPARARC